MGNDPSSGRSSNANVLPIHRLARTDTTTAQAGSPPRSPDENAEADTSKSSANTSFPLSESALPTTFDTSGDIAPSDFSAYFPLPPSKSSRMTIVASDSTSNDIFSQPIEKIWAPAKTSPVRMSAPVSPITPTLAPLIDFGSDTIPATPSFTSAETSFELRSSSSGYQSGNSSGLDVGVKEFVPRKETLTQLVDSHPELNFGLLDISEKNDGRNGLVNIEEPIQLPPVTYADAANIASKYPELASKVLNEPIATPVQNTVGLPAEEEDSYYPIQETAAAAEPEPEPAPVPHMPAHTSENPNWALAPDEPEYYAPRPRRREYNDSYGGGGGGGYGGRDRDRDRRGSGGYGRDDRSPRGYADNSHGGGDRSRFDNQRDSDNSWSNGGDRSQRNGDRSQQDNAWAYNNGGNASGRNDDEEYRHARNGLSRRPWSQEQGGNDRSHDTPLHLRNGGGGGDQSYRLPSRTYEREDSFNTNTPVENENDNSGAPSGGDEWNPTHDGWATRDEPSPATAPREVPSEGQAVDSWGAPAHDPWVSTQTQTTRTATPARATPPSRLAPVPETDIYQASSREAAIANEWVAHHDPWAASLGADENSSNGQSQVQKPEPESNKYDSPSRGHGSALRDNKNGGHFVPSQSSVAALAASRATEMYDSAGSVDPHELPAEFNYFMHSETVDWTGTEPTKVTQNSFSPSQNLKTNTPTPPPVNAPQPRNTQSFDYDQQVSQDEYSGAGEGSFTLGKMKTEHYEPSQSDYKRVPPLQWGRGDENENRGGGYDRDRERGGDRDRRDYGDDRRGDERRGGDEWNDFEYGGGRRGGDDYDSGRGRRGDDYGRGRDDYDGRGGHRYDDDNRGGRRGDDYNTSGGRFDDNNGPPRNKYGGAGPLPGPYKGPPRTTSFGNPNFVPPSLNDY